VRLHLHLEHIVVVDVVAPQVWQTWVLDYNSSRHVLGYHIVLDQSRRHLLGQKSARVVVQNLVIFNDPFRVDQHNAIEIVVYDIVVNQQLFFPFDDKDAFAFRVLDNVVFDLGHSRFLTSDGNVRFNVGVDLVRDYRGVAPLHDQDSLVVVVSDDVAVRETLKPERSVNVIFKVLHCNLVSEVLIVHLGRLLLDSLESRKGLSTELRRGIPLIGRLAVAIDINLLYFHAWIRLIWEFLDVIFGCSSNMRHGFFHYFNSTLPVVGNDVPSDIWFTMRAEHYNAVEGALLDLVSPDERHRPSSVVESDYLNTVLVGFQNLVVKYFRFVILDLYSNSADLYLVLNNVSIYVEGSDDG